MTRFRLVPILVCLATTSVLPQPTFADEIKPPEGLKCFIMKKRKVKEKYAVDYRDAKLFLCCKSCVKRFGKTPEKYEAKANHQLVLTGQFVQKACPVSGESVDAGNVLEIAGVDVRFAASNHLDSIAKMEVDDQIQAIFGEDGFEKGEFEPAKKKETTESSS